MKERLDHFGLHSRLGATLLSGAVGRPEASSASFSIKVE
jgi:hypothetical protein